MSYQDRLKSIISEFSITPHAELFDLCEEADQEIKVNNYAMITANNILREKLEAKDQLIDKFKQNGFVLHGRLADKDDVINHLDSELEANKKEIAELNKMLLNAFQITKNGWCVGNHNFDEYLELVKLEHGSDGLLTKEDRGK